MEAYLVALVLGTVLLAGSLLMSKNRGGRRPPVHLVALGLAVAGLVGIALEGLGAGGTGVTMAGAAGCGLAAGLAARTPGRR